MKTVSKTLILFCLIFSTVYAQKNVLRQINDARRTATNAETLKPFTIATTKQSLKNSLTPTNSSQQLILNSSILKQIETTKPSFLKLSIPNSETTFFNLELIPIEIFAPNFKVVNSKDQEVPAERGIHYKGIIEGDANSLVSISFINGTVGGIISNQAGNFNLSKMKDSENYILFNDKDLTARLNFPCGVEDGLEKILPEDVATRTINAPNVACGAVQIYVEADFALYQAPKATYRAKAINLNAGFAANNGTIFRAEIGGCN
jgi:hypothetical protein